MKWVDRVRDSRVARLVWELLSQGISPKKIAWTLALTSLLALFPLLGTTTLLCAAAAWFWKLNMPLAQLVNYLLYPLQLLFLLPFWRAGAWLFGSQAPSTLSEMVKGIQKDPWGSLALWGWTALEGVGVWALVSSVLVPVFFLLFSIVLDRIWKGKKAHG